LSPLERSFFLLVAPEISPLVAPEVLADIAIGLGRTISRGDADLLGAGVRRYARLLNTPAYDAWLIEWDHDADLDLHDHGGSSGAFHVVDGVLVEVYTDLARPEPLRTLVLGAGDARQVTPGRVHRLWNPGPAKALSVHVYSPPLSSMTFYEDHPDCYLAALRSEPVDVSAPEPRSAMTGTGA
jgi:hypothetical protein